MEKNRLLGIIATVIAVLLSLQLGWAGEETKTAAEQFEYDTGWNVGVFGGANLFQSGHVDISSPAVAGTAGANTDSQLNAVAGVKGGYTWSGFDLGSSVKALPALDGEFFYTGSDYKATGSLAGFPDAITTTMDAYVFSVDPKLKLQIGRFRPYVGFGVGAAYLTASNGTASVGGVPIFSGGHMDDVVLALQGVAGVETFVSKNWSIDVGYKYLDLVDPTFNSPGVVHYQGHSVTEHLVTAGVNFYF